MAERPWRVQIEPVGTLPELVSIARRRPWDRVVGVLLLGALALAVLKPWGGAPVERRPVPDDRAVASATQNPPAGPIPAPVDPARASASLPSAVFAPPARNCMQDLSWRVCVLGADDGQATRNVWAPDAPPLVDRTGAPQPADPAVVIATTSGAALAFYPPNGFYTADDPGDAAIGHPDSALGAAWGPIVVTAWSVAPSTGGRWLELHAIGPLSAGGQVASNVYIPPDEALADAPIWPSGRYVVWLQGSGVQSWEQFFDVQVVATQSAAMVPDPH